MSFYGGTRQRLTPNDATIKMNFTRKSDDSVSRSINFIRFSRFLRRPPSSLSMNLAFRQLLYVFSQRCAARASGKFTEDIRKTPRDRLFRRCILLFLQKLPRILRADFHANYSWRNFSRLSPCRCLLILISIRDSTETISFLLVFYKIQRNRSQQGDMHWCKSIGTEVCVVHF